MAKFRFLHLIKPLQHVLPEIENPVSRAYISFDDKVLYTIGIAIFYIVSQLPIYGVKSVNSDPFAQFRNFFGAEKGTLAEFGLLPIITSGFLWQFLAGFKVISVNFGSRNDRTYFQSLQKISAILIATVYAFVFSYCTNYYNPGKAFENAIVPGTSFDAVSSSSTKAGFFGTNFVIFFQLVAYNFLLVLVVEILDKDYGFSSGPLVLTAVTAATNFIVSLFDFQAIVTRNGYERQGVFAQLFVICKNLFTSWDLSAFATQLVHLYSRSSATNMFQVVVALAVFGAVFYLQSFHLGIAIKPKQAKAMSQTYPVKLFYNGSLPLIFTATVLYNLQLWNYVVYSFINFTEFGAKIIALLSSNQDVVKYLKLVVGDYVQVYTNYASPTYSRVSQISGLTSYFVAPVSFTSAILSPLHTAVYLATVVGLCVFFASNWYKFSGSSGKEIAEMFSKQNITIMGKREVNVAHYLNKTIYNASIAGGLILASIQVVSDFLGSYGYTSAVVTSILIALNFLEEFYTEYQQTGGSSDLYSAAFGQGSLF